MELHLNDLFKLQVNIKTGKNAVATAIFEMKKERVAVLDVTNREGSKAMTMTDSSKSTSKQKGPPQ